MIRWTGAREVINLHDVTEALLTEDIFEEDQVFFVVSVWMELRGEQGQSLVQPYGAEKNQNDDSKLQKKNKTVWSAREHQVIRMSWCVAVPVLADTMGMASVVEEAVGSRGRTGKIKAVNPLSVRPSVRLLVCPSCTA